MQNRFLFYLEEDCIFKLKKSKLDQIERLFFIINYLTNHEYATARDLAELCNTSQRTIYRDMKKLEEVGFYFDIDYKYGYKLLLTPTKLGNHLTLEEFMALMLYPIAGNISESHPLNAAYKKGKQKVLKFVRNVGSNIDILLDERIIYQRHIKNLQNFKVLPILINAMADNIVIEASYYTISRDKLNTRKLNPYVFVQRENHLYVIAYCHKRKEIRVFRLDRFHDVHLTDSSFTIPSSFDIDLFLAERWSIMDEGVRTKFVVNFSSEVARYVLEQSFNVQPEILKNDDGSLILTVTVKSKEEFLRWIRSFGIHATVISPEHVREQLKFEYQTLIKRYE